MKKSHIERLVSFLIGLSWGVSIFAFIVVFKSYIAHGFLTASLLGLFAFLAGMCLVVVFEYISFKVTSQKIVEEKLDRLISLLSHDKLSDN